MNSYDFFIYEFICCMNSYMNSGVPRFQMTKCLCCWLFHHDNVHLNMVGDSWPCIVLEIWDLHTWNLSFSRQQSADISLCVPAESTPSHQHLFLFILYPFKLLQPRSTPRPVLLLQPAHFPTCTFPKPLWVAWQIYLHWRGSFLLWAFASCSDVLALSSELAAVLSLIPEDFKG